VFAAFAVGMAAQGSAWRATDRRLTATFGAAVAIEAEVAARILSAPERDREGGRELIVESTGERGFPRLRLRLEVVDVPSDDATRIDALRRGDLIRVWCLLRAPEGGPGTTLQAARRRLAAARLDATGRVKSSRLVRRIARGAWTPGRLIDVAHAGARDALDSGVGSADETRGVLGAMLLGDRLLLDDETNGLLRDAGLVHILSISGLHTSITVLVLLGLLRRAGLHARGSLFAGAASLIAFSAFVGHGASVWRACASVGVGLVARALSRDVDGLSSLALASAALVVAVPSLAFNLGFLLSVMGTAGLLALCPSTARGGRRPSTLARSVAASTGAYLATAPLLAVSFGRLAPVALVSNLVAAPLCAACLASGAAAILLAPLPFLGTLSAQAARLSVAALLSASRGAAAVPGGHLRVARPPSWLAAAYVALLLGAWMSSGGRSRQVRRGLALALALCTVALHLGPRPPGQGATRVEVLDVGQGLAVVLRGADGRFALVDAGPSGHGRFDAGDRLVVPALTMRGCRRLDVLALSHDHDDHAGGARAVLRDVEVGELWVGAGSEKDPLTRALIAEAVARGVAVRRLHRGESARRAGLELTVLHPGLADRGRSLNDRCLVLRAATSDGASILLPGDLESGGESALLTSGADPGSGALVAPHHGANGSSTPAFLARVSPRFVLVSAGARNRFGHPGAAALARFGAASARVLRTDRDGTIRLTAEGRSWTASVEGQGYGDEREDEDPGQSEGQEDAPGADRLGLVDQAGMPVPQPEQDEKPQAVGGRRAGDDALHHDERRERADGRE
jgi:competence protein ComEC